MDTLILNADGLPLSVVPMSAHSWQEAIKLMFSDQATVAEEYTDWEVHSPHKAFPVPSVMILKTYIKAARSVKFNRTNILLRDDHKCQYCGVDAKHDHSMLTQDHVVPRFHGGKTSWTNIVAACHSCNLEKAHYMKMKPNTVPKKPTYYELVQKRMKMPVTVPDAAWIDYLGWDPALVTVRPRHQRSRDSGLECN